MGKVFDFGCSLKDIDSVIMNEGAISELRELLKPAQYTSRTITPLRTGCGEIKLVTFAEVPPDLIVARNDKGKIIGGIRLKDDQ